MLSVITNPENGWDCLVTVVSEVTDEVEQICDKNGWMILASWGTLTAEQFVRNYGDEDE